MIKVNLKSSSSSLFNLTIKLGVLPADVSGSCEGILSAYIASSLSQRAYLNIFHYRIIPKVATGRYSSCWEGIGSDG